MKNLAAVLEKAGSSLRNVVKVNIFLDDMTNFAAMNRAYDVFFHEEPKPVRWSPIRLYVADPGADHDMAVPHLCGGQRTTAEDRRGN